MSSPADPGSATRLALRARLVGECAARALDTETFGQVLAVFAHTCYVRLGASALICVGGPELPPGPLHVGCDRWVAEPVFALLPGAQARAVGRTLLLADRLAVSMAGAARWQAPTPASPPEAIETDRCRALEAAVLSRAGEEGLCRQALTGRATDPVGRAAAPALVSLVAWLEACAAGGEPADPHAQIARLLGLGPGLTPSGDDLLAGVLVALTALGRAPAAHALARLLGPRLDHATGEISAAHLRAAMAGQAAEPVHRFAAALAGGVGVRAAITGLERFGHTSGWDAAAGVLLVGRALETLRASARGSAADRG